MNNKIKAIFNTAFLALACASCNPSNYFNQVENVDVGNFKSTLTPNCQLNDGLPAVISVEATLPAFGPTYGYQIQGAATVKLYENGVLLGAYEKDSIGSPNNFANNYFNPSLFAFQPGQAYKLEVTHPNYPACTAVDTMPNRVTFSVIKTSKLIYKSNDRGPSENIVDTFAEIQISFTDAPGKDYYRLIVSDSNFNLTDGSGSIYMSKTNRFPISYDPIFSGGLQGSAGDNVVFPNDTYFEDITFDGKQKMISLYMPIGTLPQFGGGPGGPGGPDGSVKPKLYVALQHHSRASHLRNKSLQSLNNNSGNPFTQPTLLYCNTVGGYGILATSSTRIDSVLIK
jgi:Domain of unknown function (DUF4249)